MVSYIAGIHGISFLNLIVVTSISFRIIRTSTSAASAIGILHRIRMVFPDNLDVVFNVSALGAVSLANGKDGNIVVCLLRFVHKT